MTDDLSPLDRLASQLEAAYWQQPWSRGRWDSLLSDRAREGWRRVARFVIEHGGRPT